MTALSSWRRTGLALLLLLCPSPRAHTNVLLILADDLGQETLGVYGGETYATPRLDALAAQGARFDHAYSQPLCTPTRVQLMTGRHNVRNYVSFGRLDKGQRTFGHAFREAGYRTFIAGKWQLSDNIAGSFQDPVDLGFDEYFLWQLDRRPQRYFAPGFEALVPSAGWMGQRVDYPAAPGNFGPDLVVDQICGFLERNQAQPFLVYYPMMLPHDPFVPPPGHPDHNPLATVEPNNPAYFKPMVEYADAMVGRLLDKLDQLGLATNTLVLFTGDNGCAQGIYSVANGRVVAGGKTLGTDAGTRVPLLARWPGRVAPGRVVDDLVSCADFLPTLAAACGLPAEADLDGQSFLPSLLDQAGPRREWVYCWSDPQNDENTVFHEFTRSRRYKLHRDGRFLDVLIDPLEQNPLPLAGLSPEALAEHAALSAALASFDPDVADRTQAPRLPAVAWENTPAPTGTPGQIAMRANAVTDRNGPASYQFRNLDTGEMSGWQTARDHAAAFNPASAIPVFAYRARDILGNTTGWVSTGTTDNPRELAVEQGTRNNLTGSQNLGQSFLAPAAVHGFLLDEFTLYSVNHTAVTGSYRLALYDGFTNRTQRGARLALSENMVTPPRVDGFPLVWRFQNLVIEGGRTYYAAVCDATGGILPAGGGILVQMSGQNPYPGGMRLNELGLTATVDLRFTVTAYRHPVTFAQWRLLHPADGGFDATAPGETQPNGLRYFLGDGATGQANRLRADRTQVSFGIAPGVSDLTWRLRHAPSLDVPWASWSSLSSGDPGVQFNADTRRVTAQLPDFPSGLFLRLEVDQPAP